jgi:predicted aspartyl protease
MNKKEFIESLGENPEDVIGMDWQNELQDIADNENKFEEAQDIKQEK